MVQTIQELLAHTPVDTPIQIGGWVRSKRSNKAVIFIDLLDGSTQHPLQLVGDPALFSAALQRKITPGASLWVDGILRASQGRGQVKEVEIQAINVLGEASEAYPLQPKRHTLDFLRTIQHLRLRSSTFRAVSRVRHATCYAIHRYFDKKGFTYLHSPIITSMDAEGAGELFDLSNTLGDRPFFGQQAHLTVSGQLAGEAAAMGLGRIYTFGPTFRAENSNTSRHLAEFWMVEPEIAFYDLNDTIDLAEDFLRSIAQDVLERCEEEIDFLTQQEKYAQKKQSTPLKERLTHFCQEPFARITYTKAIEILQARKKKFAYPVKWGVDLQTEHEQYLVHKLGAPVVVTDYPKEIKAFYMRQNDDSKTVAALDILLPGIGEVVGGSQREERYDVLRNAMDEKAIDPSHLEWYLDTRRFGSVPHSGFGLGLERIVQFFTSMDNIRDVIPFPRTPGHAVG